MRRVLAATVVGTMLLFAACTDQPPTAPAETSGETLLGKRPPGNCLTADQQALTSEIRTEIEALFPGKKGPNPAIQQLNNIERKVCDGDFADATDKAWGFLALVVSKMPDNFIGDAEESADLVSQVFALAGDPDAIGGPFVIPPGAFEPTGGILTFDPTAATPESPIVVSTMNGEAAVVVDDPGIFPPGTGLVTIVLARAPGNDVTSPGGFIPGFQAYEEGYEIFSSAQPWSEGPGVLVALCVVPPAPSDVVIGHLHEGSVSLLVPTEPDPETLGYIDCSNVNATTVALNLQAAPGWLQLARGLARPVLKLLAPPPLNATVLAVGRGLGGRTQSLSLNAPVDPEIDVGETIQLSVGTDATWESDDEDVATVDGTGLVTGEGAGTTTITAYFGGEEVLSMDVTVLGVGGGHLIVYEADPTEDWEIYKYDLDSEIETRLTFSSLFDGDPTWSPDGSRIAFSSNRTESYHIYTMYTDGFGLSSALGVSGAVSPSWSPDGTQIAYVDGQGQPHVMDALTGANDVTITTVSYAQSVDWSPDGTMLVTDPEGQIAVVNSDGTGVATYLTDGDGTYDYAPAWSPDGTQIAFTREIPDVTSADVFVMEADGSNPVNLTISYGGTDAEPGWSPDGTQIVFWSDRNDGAQIYLMDADGSNVTSLNTSYYSLDPEWQPEDAPPPPVVY